jgi:hypothetical protein
MNMINIEKGRIMLFVGVVVEIGVQNDGNPKEKREVAWSRGRCNSRTSEFRYTSARTLLGL